MKPTDPELYSTTKAKVKSSVKRWPSAYASGMVVSLYEKEMKRRGLKPFFGPVAKKKTAPLTRWFSEEWVDILTGKPCGSVHTSAYYPTCRPKAVANALTPGQILARVSRKQRAGPKTVKSSDQY